jgi:hypothetical protein
MTTNHGGIPVPRTKRRIASALAAAGLVAATLLGGAATAAAADTAVPGAFTWVNAKSGKCMAVSGGAMTAGTPVIQWACNGNIDQYWEEVDYSGDEIFTEFRSAKDRDFCLAVPHDTTQIGVQLIIWPCGLQFGHLWDPIPVRLGSGVRWLLHNYVTDKFAAVSQGRTDRGAPVIQWNATGDLSQYWFPRY